YAGQLPSYPIPQSQTQPSHGPVQPGGLSLQHIRYLSQRTAQYASMLKSARQALHTLQTSTTPRSPSAAAQNLQSINSTLRNSAKMSTTIGSSNQCAMPCGGFLVL